MIIVFSTCILLGVVLGVGQMVYGKWCRANGVGQLCIVLNIGVDLGLDICIALHTAVCSTG